MDPNPAQVPAVTGSRDTTDRKGMRTEKARRSVSAMSCEVSHGKCWSTDGPAARKETGSGARSGPSGSRGV